METIIRVLFCLCALEVCGAFGIQSLLQSTPLSGSLIGNRQSQQKSFASPPPSTLSQMLPVLNLKKKPNHPPEYHKQKISYEMEMIEEIECSESMFMSPFHNPVMFTLNDSVYDRGDKNCRWSFTGTEPCIPMISCSTLNIQSCEDEYLEIYDGHKGVLKVCKEAASSVVNVTAADDLRDLFVQFKALKAGKKVGVEKINCTVVCSKRGDGVPIFKNFEPIVNPKCYCGSKPNEDRIVNGETAKKNEFPWLVALVETNTRQPFCGGSIINNKFILTAGHCIKGKFTDYTNIQVVVNGHAFDSSPNLNVLKDKPPPKSYQLEELERLDRSNGSLRVNIEEIIVHPLYVSETNDFDVCLLRLSTPLDLSQKPTESQTSVPRSICIPDPSSYLRTYSNKKAIIAGWGLPDIEAEGTPLVLQKLIVNVFSPKVCKEMYAHRVNRRMMCAGHREGGKDACAGDSGGPLIVEDRHRVWVQVASVSWGEGCAVKDNPGVYFRTTESGQWARFHSNSAAASWCAVPPE